MQILRRYTFPAALCLLLTRPLQAQLADTLKPILENLASPDFAKREAAQRDLNQIPASQMQSLQQFAAAQNDPEITARLLHRVESMAIERLAIPPTLAGHIQGRLLDVKGHAIAGARVHAQTSAMGQELGYADLFTTHSDDQGRFNLPVPFDQIMYQVTIQKQGFLYSARRCMPDSGPIGDIQLTPTDGNSLKGILIDQNSQPVAGKEVRLLGEDDNIAIAISNTDGSLEWTGLDYFGSNAVPEATVGDLVAPYERVGIGNNFVRVQLAKPGTLTGTVRDDKTSDPLPNAEVSAGRYKTRADKNGKYLFPAIPPGEYIMNADSPGYMVFPPRGYLFETKPAKIAAGASVTADLALGRTAILTGTVLGSDGKPEAGALVGVRSLIIANERDEWRFVTADAHGYYVLPTGQPRGLTVAAFSPHDGLSTAKATAMRGQLQNLPPIQLPGAVRVKGLVTDSAGKPIANVQCTASTTVVAGVLSDANGTFDLGQVSLMYARRSSGLVFTPPIPAPQAFGMLSLLPTGDPAVVTPPAPGAPTVFYLTKVTGLEGKPGDTLNVKAVLDPGQLVSFTGIVKDADGKPIPKARVSLLTGNATKERWLEKIVPPRIMRNIVDTKGTKLEDMITMLAETYTDADGRWTFQEVATNGRIFRLQWGMPIPGLDKICVGIYVDNGINALLPAIEVPKTAGETQMPFQFSKTADNSPR